MRQANKNLPEVVELVGELCNDQLDVRGCARLEELLLGDEECLLFYVEYLDEHSALQCRSKLGGHRLEQSDRLLGSEDWLKSLADPTQQHPVHQRNGAAKVASDLPALPVQAQQTSQRTIVLHIPGLVPGGGLTHTRTFWLLVGAIVNFVVVALLMLLLRPFERGPEAPGRDTLAGWHVTQDSAPRPERRSVASVAVAENCRWENPDPTDSSRPPRDLRKGDPLSEGETLQLASGVAAIVFEDGANVVLEGPAVFELRSAGGAALERGKLLAKVPPSAVGFTIETANARIVDLGTEFGVRVDGPGRRTEVTVFRGEVSLTGLERGNSPSEPPRVIKTQRLVARQAVSVGPVAGNGRIEMRPVRFDRDGFSRTLPSRLRPAHSTPPSTQELPGGLTLIRPSVVGVNSEHFGGSATGGRLGLNVVNGYGLNVGPSGILGAADSTHDNAEDTVWHQATLGNGSNTFISFNLGGVYDLQTTRIWNLNQKDTTRNGAKDIEIWVSHDDLNYDLLKSITLKQAGGTPADPAQDFATSARGVKYVKFVIPTGYGFGADGESIEGFKGLSEVRFEGKPAAVEHGQEQQKAN